MLSQTIALKGGTAINLTIFDLPRLSVDIDLDYCGSLDRTDMLLERKIITNTFTKYMVAKGYTLSEKTKYYHALDSFVYEYTNCGGVRDNIKIEINYMLRAHILPLAKRKVALPWSEENLTVFSLAPVEIFSAKTVALLTRTAPRDLYDIHNMVRYGLFDESEQEMFRKCVIFYSAIGNEKVPKRFALEKIGNISAQHIKPELVFEKGDELERVVMHPMALWKGQNYKEKGNA